MPTYVRPMLTTTDSKAVVERYLAGAQSGDIEALDRKSTRLNSSHIL